MDLWMKRTAKSRATAWARSVAGLLQVGNSNYFIKNLAKVEYYFAFHIIAAEAISGLIAV